MTDPALRPPEHLEILEFSRRRRLFMWIWVLLTTALLIGALVLANLITAKHRKRIDLTREQAFTINPATREILGKINLDIDIYVTYLDSGPYEGEDRSLPPAYDMLKNILTEFHIANPRINVKFAEREGDPALGEIRSIFKDEPAANMVYMVARRDPPLKQAFPIQTLYQGDPKTGSLLVFFAEPRLTAALVQAASDHRGFIYYTVGHGELSPSRPDNLGLTTLARTLDTWANMALKELNFANMSEIPTDCDAILIAGFGGSLSPPEVNIIDAYLRRGGRLFVSLNPDKDAGRGLTQLLERWGVRITADVVFDPTSARYRIGADAIVVSNFENHEINRGMNNVGLLMIGCRAVEPIPGDRRAVTVLMYAPPTAWAQPLSRKVIQQEQTDPVAPPIAVCSQQLVEGGKTARIVAWGAYLGLSNVSLATGTELRDDHCGYVLNNFRWLLEQEGMIVAPPKRMDRRPLDLKPQQANLMFAVVVVVLPLVGIVLGVIAWFFRRK